MEFALVLPLLLMMALVVVQVGLIVQDRLQVEAAARTGARAAAVTEDPAAIRSAAMRAAASLDPSRTDVSVDRVGARGAPVTVTVLSASPIHVPLVGWVLPDEVAMEASVTARQEFG